MTISRCQYNAHQLSFLHSYCCCRKLFFQVSGMSIRSCFASLALDMVLFYIDFTQTLSPFDPRKTFSPLHSIFTSPCLAFYKLASSPGVDCVGRVLHYYLPCQGHAD